MQLKLFDLFVMRKCIKCNQEKPATAEFFSRQSYDKDKLLSQCKVCRNRYNKQYRETNKASQLEYGKQYYQKNKEAQLEYARRYRQANREIMMLKKRQRYKINRDKLNQQRKNNNKALRAKVISHYSNRTNTCYCCGMTGLLFLEIDHINGDGAEHRKKNKLGGYKIYTWLIRNNFPEGFRVACRNCNFATYTTRICPHKQKRILTTQRAKHKLKLKQIVVNHYTEGSMRCQCCGYSGIEFLSVDHINGDGKEHRKTIGTGFTIYRWLIKNNFPRDFQILCIACNHAKGANDKCPHQTTA